MAPAWILAIYIAGLIAMVIEMFLPGAVLGTIGFLTVCGSIIYAFATGETLLGGVLCGVTVALVPVLFLMWRGVLGNVMAIKDTLADARSSSVSGDLLGKTGETTSMLRPTGTATIDGHRYSVVTRGEMLEKGTSVKVIDVTGSRIVVKKA